MKEILVYALGGVILIGLLAAGWWGIDVARDAWEDRDEGEDDDMAG